MVKYIDTALLHFFQGISDWLQTKRGISNSWPSIIFLGITLLFFVWANIERVKTFGGGADMPNGFIIAIGSFFALSVLQQRANPKNGSSRLLQVKSGWLSVLRRVCVCVWLFFLPINIFLLYIIITKKYPIVFLYIADRVVSLAYVAFLYFASCIPKNAD